MTNMHSKLNVCFKVYGNMISEFQSLLIFLYVKVRIFLNFQFSLVDPDVFFDLLPHKCHYPILDPFNEEIMKLLKAQDNSTTSIHNCSWKTNNSSTIFMANHEYLIKTGELNWKHREWNHEKPTCCYRPFYRVIQK